MEQLQENIKETIKQKQLLTERLKMIQTEKNKVEQMIQHAKNNNQPTETIQTKTIQTETIQTLYGQFYELQQGQIHFNDQLEDIQLELEFLGKQLKNKKQENTKENTKKNNE